MKKSWMIISLVLLLSVSVVSAGFFDWFTGNVVAEPENNLVAYYKFESSVEDYSGNGNDGSNTGIEFVAGMSGLGNAGSFDGSDYFSVNNDKSINNLSAFTWSVWIKPSDAKEYTTLINKQAYGTSWSKWLFVGSANRLRTYIQGVNDTSTARSSSIDNTLKLNEWQHIAMTYNDAGDRKTRTYVNGVEVSYLRQDASSGVVPDDSNYGLWIGRNYNDAHPRFKGLMDELRVYDKVLSASEIKALANIAVEEPEANVTATCTDSDGSDSDGIYKAGQDIYSKGNVKYKNHINLDSPDGTLFDYCYDSLSVAEFRCNVKETGSFQDMNLASCPNGCFDGACLSASNITCTDSDNGKDYYEKGYMSDGNFDWCSINEGNGGLVESCNGDDCKLVEHYCDTEDNPQGVYSELYACPNSCVSGVCVDEENSCQTFLSGLSDIVLDDWNNWELRYNDSWEGWEAGQKNYYASFRYKGDDNEGESYVHIESRSFSNKERAQEELDSALGRDLCEQEKLYLDDGSEQVVYVCKNLWRIAYASRELSDVYDNYENDVVVLWFNGNVLINAEISTRDYDNCYSYEDCKARQQERHIIQQRNLVEALEKLIDNSAEYVGGIYIDYPAKRLIEYFASICESQIEEVGYIGSWSCKMEPVVCPPHGEQTETCTRWNSDMGEDESRKRITECSPGICSGCYVSRWFQYDWGNNNGNDNICIPYGIRVGKQNGWTIEEVTESFSDSGIEGLSVGEAMGWDDVDLEVYENGSAYLKVSEWKGSPSYYLSEGDKVDILGSFESSVKLDEYYMIVDSISFDSENYEDSSIQLTFYMKGNRTYENRIPDYLNLYCDMDGRMKEQTTIDGDGNWAKCQNNYECESNICSSGQCIEVTQMIRETSRLKGAFFSFLCKLGNPISDDNYAECISGFLK